MTAEHNKEEREGERKKVKKNDRRSPVQQDRGKLRNVEGSGGELGMGGWGWLSQGFLNDVFRNQD